MRRGGPRAGSVGPAGVYGQIFPRGSTSGRPSTGCPRRSRSGASTSHPAHEDEFNEWYNTEYLIGNMTVNGVYSARRYLNRGTGPRYPHRVRVRPHRGEPAACAGPGAPQSVWRRRIERLWAHASGSPGIYRRLAAR